jgi:hypothetical protein
VVIQDGASTWEVIAAVGTMLGGVGAAVGAVFAAIAARSSRATSKDALEALAVGIRPRPGYYFSPKSDSTGTRVLAAVDNPSEWPASDLTFEFRFRDGRVVHDSAERLPPGGDEEWSVVLLDSPPPNMDLEREADYAVLRYSDDRGIARYEQRTVFTDAGLELHEARIR